ncbi:MAG: RNA polymerase-binding protein DksA [Pseudomonadota bacterium]|nr:RNA polymerase-binding protein DksA [Pseudomonadota bacterium]
MTGPTSSSYSPSDDEPFMSEVMREYFRQRLVSWKTELLRDAESALLILQEEMPKDADLSDRASAETGRTVELRTRDRARKLIVKIDEALIRIEQGIYGYCVETGEPIGVKRLEARPIANLSVEAQERHERLERTQRDV